MPLFLIISPKQATFKPVKKQQTNFGPSKKLVKTCYELVNSVQVGQWQGLWYVARVYNKRHFGNSQSFEYHGSNSMQLLPSFNPINDQANFLTIIQIRWNLLNLMIQWNLDLRKPDLRKIVGATDFLVHKLFDLRKIFKA